MMEYSHKFFISCLFLSISPSFVFGEPQSVCYSDSSEDSYVDQAYHYLNTKFCQPAVWFDSFFVDNTISHDPRAGTMIRFYSDFSWTESTNFDYKNRLSASLRLPKVSRKLKLIFESDDEEDRLAIFSNNQDTQSSLGLRYDVTAKERSSFNIKVSLRPSIEARYRYTYQLTEKIAAGFTQKLYQKKRITGESTQFYIDYSFTDKFLLRWANFAQYTVDKNSFELGTGFTLYQYLSPKQAINYSASIMAQDRPPLYINNYHLSMTYRHNILRKWFFYEITPEINWDKDFNNNRSQEAAITLRLEVLFNNV